MLVGLVAAAMFLSASMAAAYLFARRTGMTGFIDAAWSAATGLAATAIAIFPEGAAARPAQFLAAALAGAWTVRLAGHIFRRSLRHGADPRYGKLIAAWGPDADRRMFLFLQAQAIAGLALVLVVAVAARRPGDPGPFDAAAAIVAAAGLIISFLADWQMERFRQSTAGERRILDRGLWAWSRHPNYFGEWLFWCAWPLLAIRADYPTGLLALAAPALMYALLRHGSGIPHLEAHLLRTRPEAFAAYKAAVPPFFPGLRRKPERYPRADGRGDA